MGKSAPISLRTQALTLWEEGISLEGIEKRTGRSKIATHKIRRRAYKRGYSANNHFTFKDEFFSDAPRSGHPRDMDEEKEGDNDYYYLYIYI